MNPIQYSTFVGTCAKSGELIANSMTPSDAHILHMAVGISGEAGELLDAIKKAVIYKKPLDLTNVIEELGDLEFYLEGLRSYLRVDRQYTIDLNVEKLRKRYPEGYSDVMAQVRADKIAGP